MILNRSNKRINESDSGSFSKSLHWIRNKIVMIYECWYIHLNKATIYIIYNITAIAFTYSSAIHLVPSRKHLNRLFTTAWEDIGSRPTSRLCAASNQPLCTSLLTIWISPWLPLLFTFVSLMSRGIAIYKVTCLLTDLECRAEAEEVGEISFLKLLDVACCHTAGLQC